MIGVEHGTESISRLKPAATPVEFRLGLIASLVFHAAVFGAFFVPLPGFLTRDDRPADVISVEFITIDEVNRITEPEQKPEPEPEPEQKAAEQPPEQKAAPEPPRQMAEAVPPPDAEIIKKPEPEVQEKPRVIPATAPRTKPRPPSKFDASRIAALLDKSVKEDTPPPQETEEQPQDKLADAVERVQPNVLQARVATATISSAMNSKIRECWNVPTGAKDARDLNVMILINLSLEGELIRPPRVIDRSRMNNDEFYRIAAESALRAVIRCAPYDLPKDMYDEWREMQLNFDPKDMFG